MTQPVALPTLSRHYPLTAEQVTTYRDKGHILLNGVLAPDEAAHCRRAISEAVTRLNTETRRIEDRDTYGKAFLQTMNLWESDAEVRNFTLASRFAHIAAQLMGVERVRLYHDQALYKEPGGGHTPWHQDQYYWPVDTDRTITMWMPLVDITEEMGMLSFASGSHVDGFLGNFSISDDSEAVLGEWVRQKGFEVERPTFMRAGDATFHSGWTLHCAPGNTSGVLREVMTVIYVADGARVTIPVNENQENDRLRWLMGLPPGALVNSRLNPVPGY